MPDVDFIKRVIEDLDGQVIIIAPVFTWKKSFETDFTAGKKFYVIFENDEFSGKMFTDTEYMYDFFKKRNVESNKVIFMSASHSLNYGFKRYREQFNRGKNEIKEIKNEIPLWIHQYFWAENGYRDESFLESIKTTEVPSKLFVSTMMTQKFDRVEFIKKLKKYKLIKYLDKISDDDVGWVSANWTQRIFEDDIDCHSHLKKNRVLQNPIGTMPSIYPTSDLVPTIKVGQKEYSMFELGNMPCMFLLRHKIKDAFCYVVMESEINSISRLTEKTLFPIFFKKPFFNVGIYRGMDILKDYGYKTFDKIFDESYQYESDLDKKLDMICTQLVELSKKDDKELVELFSTVEDITEHNYNVLMSCLKSPKEKLKNYLIRHLEKINE